MDRDATFSKGNFGTCIPCPHDQCAKRSCIACLSFMRFRPGGPCSSNMEGTTLPLIASCSSQRRMRGRAGRHVRKTMQVVSMAPKHSDRIAWHSRMHGGLLSEASRPEALAPGVGALQR
eukprot:1726453-Pyramimonas_sp.AAC.1